MASIGWLHLTDLHQGKTGSNYLFPVVQREFFRDLEGLDRSARPFDLVLFTGDLTQRGTAAEFAALNQTLGNLRGHLSELGSQPLLLAVPGNHDLWRPPTLDPVTLALRHGWHAEPRLREEFWEDEHCPYRIAIEDAFSPFSEWYAAWRAAAQAPPGVTWSFREGLLPGDFVSTVEKDGLRLGVMGLNTAFLQLTGDDYLGQLDLDVRQVHHLCEGDLPAWVERHHLTLLLTHHPVSWLHPRAQGELRTNIAPQGYFHVHLFGHMHESSVRALSEGGGPQQVQSQGASLFGQETFGPGEPRVHGYSAARLSVAGSDGTLRLWPRIATKTQGGYVMGPDLSFGGLDRRSFAATASLRAHMPLVRGAQKSAKLQARRVPLPPGRAYDHAWYVHRAEERTALNYLAVPGAPVVLCAPDRFGKTWMLSHLCERVLKDEGGRGRAVQLDLDQLESRRGDSLDELLRELGSHIVEALGARQDLVHRAFEGPSPATLKLTRLVARLLSTSEGLLLLVLNRADALGGHPGRDSFFGTLRAWSCKVAEPHWPRLRLLLGLSASPARLIANPDQSPFNLTPPIYLGDFNAEQIERMAEPYQLGWGPADIERLMGLVGGQPYLARLLMYRAAEGTPLAGLLAEEGREAVFGDFLQRRLGRIEGEPALKRAVLSLLQAGAGSALATEDLERLAGTGLVATGPGAGGAARLRYPLYEWYLRRLGATGARDDAP